METLKISRFFDILTTSTLFFMLFFCWIRFYTKNWVLSLFLAIILTFLCVFVIFFWTFKKQKKKTFNKEEQKNAHNCALQLQFSKKNCVFSFFEEILKEKFRIQKKETGFLVLDKKIFIAPNFSGLNLSFEDFVKIFAEAKDESINELIICSNNFDETTKNFTKSIKNLKITLYDMYETYFKLIKPSNKTPKQVVETNQKKLKFKEIFALSFSRKRTKNYALFGIILILSSFFVPFKIYYLLSGSFLLVLAVLTLILPNIKTFKKT